jgi:hypothetical protein
MVQDVPVVEMGLRRYTAGISHCHLCGIPDGSSSVVAAAAPAVHAPAHIVLGGWLVADWWGVLLLVYGLRVRDWD